VIGVVKECGTKLEEEDDVTEMEKATSEDTIRDS